MAVEATERELPLRERILNYLRDEIISGRMCAGERLLEADVAARFSVSRVPVREAIRHLESEGLVTLAHHRGATVSAPSVRAGLELLQIRRTLEGLAAGLAADNYGGPVAADIIRLVREAQRQVEMGNMSRHLRDVNLFHELIAEASGNAELAQLLSSVRRKVKWIFAIDVDQRAHHSWLAHAEILGLILSGDAAAAQRAMDSHVAEDQEVFARLRIKESSPPA